VTVTVTGSVGQPPVQGGGFGAPAAPAVASQAPVAPQGYAVAPQAPVGYAQAPGYAPQASGYAPQVQAGVPQAPVGYAQAPGYAPQAPGYAVAPQATAPAGSFVTADMLRARLQNIITVRGLLPLYPPQQVEAVVAHLLTVDWNGLAQRWKVEREIVLDFAALALFDIAIFADDSGSMAFEEGGERIEDLKLVVSRVAEVASLFDRDGITVRFINSSKEGDNLRTAADVEAMFQGLPFNGGTQLGTQLNQKLLQPFVTQRLQNHSFTKPVLVIVVTDGEPSGESRETTSRVIQGVRSSMHRAGIPGGVLFEFAQVGTDARAQAFLGQLDNDPTIGDVVDATSGYEFETAEFARKGVTLTPELWMLKLMLGAVDPSYDEQD
jgi:hypothetical protein